MNAAQLTELLRFKGGMPYMILRDHEVGGGRVKVYCGGKRVATAAPGELIGADEQAFLLSFPDSIMEFRGSWTQVAEWLSVLQQTGSWNDVMECAEGQWAFDEF